ncbi:MAG: glycosyltransferase family 2 protein [Thermoleophilaceae bacterium]
MAGRLRAGILRRLRGPYRDIAGLELRLHQRIEQLERRVEDLGELAREELSPLLRALAAEDSENRRRLAALRASEVYERSFAEGDPLVSVTVATCGRPELLAERCLPSILAQTHENLEVVVVGDAVGDATAQAVAALADPRVRYSNLAQRYQAVEDPNRHWLVASTMARNEAMRLATGLWVVAFDDDDAMRADHVERLLRSARQERAEVSYGQVRLRWEDGERIDLGTFPPELAGFSWVGALYHAGLRFFEREHVAAHLGLPGDWYLCDRMLRAGVRFHMVEAVVADAYPSERHHALRRAHAGR